MPRRATAGSKRARRAAGLALEGALLLGILALAVHIGSPGARSDPETAPGAFLRADANDDARVDLSDAVFTLDYLFLGGPEPPCLAAADPNDDGAIELTDPVYTLNFLFQGGPPPLPPWPDADVDPTDDLGCRLDAAPTVPEPGAPGGPDRALDEAERELWLRGFELFDGRFATSAGLGPRFNGDSCRGCHSDPVVGGAGGLDLNVVRFEGLDDTGAPAPLPCGQIVSRQSTDDSPREEIHADSRVVETRQSPSLLGLGLVDRLPDEVLLALADPDDTDGDGISGRARWSVDVDGAPRVARFGHKAVIPSLRDFAADALAQELGVTVDASLSDFAVPADADAHPDPELAAADVLALAFFMEHLAPPPRSLPEPGTTLARHVEEGDALFAQLGCDACHVRELAGEDGPVPALSDFLLHDVADPARHYVGDGDVEPREFRTAPLWGCRDTPPYLHDGSAESLEAAILGHYGEAGPARAAYEALPPGEREKVRAFLESL